MARNYYYHCRICHGRYDGARTPGIVVCEPDHTDMVRLKMLYTKIVVKHPSLKKASMGEVMERLWAWYLKQNNIEEPAPVETKELTIEELEHIF